MSVALPIRTASLILRPFAESDFEDIAAQMGDAGVTRYLYWGPRTREESRIAFEKRMTGNVIAPGVDYIALVIADAATGRFAGEVSLMHMANPHRNGEIGYILHPDFHGRGVATEAATAMRDIAFRELGLHRLTAGCDDRNTGSWRVMEKLGMRREAHFVRNEFVKGEWTGGIIYAMLDEEWRALQA
ncbi:Spermidine N(1)-acetyltransferase [Alphaproteobacteria bacterium SO-S41]|nr:Spermidine N(1)-acetyltransferase [Alphaproteobacteria bacterium SO-S41]